MEQRPTTVVIVVPVLCIPKVKSTKDIDVYLDSLDQIREEWNETR